MTAKRGRPKSESAISREVILTTSLEILDQTGMHGFSMRALALQLNVTPMALYHHFANRTDLLKELSDSVYGQVIRDFADTSGDMRDKIKNLLILYYQTGLRHPNLTLTIFSTPEAFSKEVKAITNLLATLLEMTKMSKERRKLWLEILIDFTHGSFIATAMVGKTNLNVAKQQTANYKQQLDELLNQIL